ncbi:type II CRISPR-associated endonuclease Cas1 [Lactobacillus sp. DCY120]|uniref:CRISPR-associated endonuclease Cas1 n=1 Tax=Bombilactobacillus apium TaxID=2675299 RepID=A0A850RC33_9LACO|nr:type II CRISPR-associated endonuclease Cas1 [Bombilactobacillus apium]
MSWRLVHVKEGDLLRLKLDNLEIIKLERKVYIPLSDITMIVLEGNRTRLTTRLLTALSKNNIALVICDEKYLPTGMYLPYGQYHHSAKRVMAQAQWSKEIKGLLWQNVVSQKIQNQISFAQWKGVEPERIELMQDLAAGMTIGDRTNREGLVAKVYFDSLYGLDFTRDQENLANSAMNFGYAIIRSHLARVLVGNGLITMLGIFHHNEFNSFNLADDLMEPFRPLIDCWIDQEILSQTDYLSYEARLKIIDFMNQKLRLVGKKQTVAHAIETYVQSFVEASEVGDPSLILPITLANFVEE